MHSINPTLWLQHFGLLGLPCAGGEIDSEDAVEGNQHYFSNNFESFHAVPWNLRSEWEVLMGIERVCVTSFCTNIHPSRTRFFLLHTAPFHGWNVGPLTPIQDGRCHLGPDSFTYIACIPGALCEGGPFLGRNWF